jgi:hypothetical protein
MIVDGGILIGFTPYPMICHPMGGSTLSYFLLISLRLWKLYLGAEKRLSCVIISRFGESYSGKRIACFRIDFLKMTEHLRHRFPVGYLLVWAEGFLFLKAKFFCYLTDIIFMNKT